MEFVSGARTDAVLSALAEQLEALGAQIELVVIGGWPGADRSFREPRRSDPFKLYAVVDQGVGKHEADLRALAPTQDELLDAARWTRTHDPSSGFADELRRVLADFGVSDADLRD